MPTPTDDVAAAVDTDDTDALAGSPTAAVLLIGNELLSGRTRDSNLQFLGESLGRLGIQVVEARVVPDIPAVIVAALNELRVRATYVFTTGGIGPTHDDITTACVAEAFGVPVVRSAEAEAMLRSHYTADKLNAARLKMADVPEGATLIENPVSKAPGYRIGNVIVMAGIPAIMQAMFANVAPTLTPGAPILSQTVSTLVAEGTLAERLGYLQQEHPLVSIGSYPFIRDGRVGVSLVLRSANEAALEAAREAVQGMVVISGGAIEP